MPTLTRIARASRPTPASKTPMGTSPSKSAGAENAAENPSELSPPQSPTPSTPPKKNKVDQRWEEHLQRLQQFKSEHGTTSVPAKNFPYATLGKWCENQRAKYNNGKLSRERIDRLKEAGFVFEGNVPRTPDRRYPAYEAKWKEHIRDLREFIDKFGHANVPARYAVNPELGKWVENRRGAYNRGEIPQSKINELNDAGFLFKVPPSPGPKPYHSYAYDNQWDERLGQLIEYRDEHGNCNVPTSFDPTLAKWAENQKSSYRRNQLRQERVEKLKAVGFDFGKSGEPNRKSRGGTEPLPDTAY